MSQVYERLVKQAEERLERTALACAIALDKAERDVSLLQRVEAAMMLQELPDLPSEVRVGISIADEMSDLITVFISGMRSSEQAQYMEELGRMGYALVGGVTTAMRKDGLEVIFLS